MEDSFETHSFATQINLWLAMDDSLVVREILLRSQSDFAICWKSPIPGILEDGGQWVGGSNNRRKCCSDVSCCKGAKAR